ncbi:MAG: tyrosine--tRNA ligase [Candidatus Poribacteria bacterium]|nr:tyrosine--tRNA ligase [Candidatus Poribacteria bacterium]
MDNVFEVLNERGFIKQTTNAEQIARLLGEEQITYYVGFDPTASSLHVGSLVPIMAMAHLQRAGHKPIAIIGGGTTMIGDPTDKTEMRPMLSLEQISTNGKGILAQLQRYLNLSDDGISNNEKSQIASKAGRFLNNADWLLSVNYIEFLRDIGKHFRVNEMIQAKGYQQRLDRELGLSFLEFNYQLLQAYDYLCLFQEYGCRLQLGGDDQWGNILAGVDLVRRVEGERVHAVTFPLLTTASGAKMGKTAGGAVWLDAERTSPYEFYQYWINVDDRDVSRFLAYFTFLPMGEIQRLGNLQDEAIREAKEILAYEATKLAHGKTEADKAQAASHAAFGGGNLDEAAMPTSAIASERLDSGIPIMELFHEVGLANSRSEARRLVQQGGAYINEKQYRAIDMVVGADLLEENALLLRAGKKRYHRIIIKKD